MLGALGGGGGGRNFPFYLKPVILRRMPEKIFLKLTSKIWFMRKLAYAAIYLWDKFQQFTLTAEVYDKQTQMTRYIVSN